MKQQETHTELSKETIDKIGFISFIVQEFAKSYKMSMPVSYQF